MTALAILATFFAVVMWSECHALRRRLRYVQAERDRAERELGKIQRAHMHVIQVTAHGKN